MVHKLQGKHIVHSSAVDAALEAGLTRASPKSNTTDDSLQPTVEKFIGTPNVKWEIKSLKGCNGGLKDGGL